MNQQEKAIETQKRIIQMAFGPCEFTIMKRPDGSIRLVAEYKIKNVLGDYISTFKALSIGKRGRIYD